MVKQPILASNDSFFGAFLNSFTFAGSLTRLNLSLPAVPAVLVWELLGTDLKADLNEWDLVCLCYSPWGFMSINLEAVGRTLGFSQEHTVKKFTTNPWNLVPNHLSTQNVNLTRKVPNPRNINVDAKIQICIILQICPVLKRESKYVQFC